MIARPHGRERIGVEKMPDRIRHGIHVPRRAGYRLRQHPAATVKHAGGEIARLTHRRAKRSADERLRLLLHDRNQPAPHDLRVQLRECGIRAANHVSVQ